ncbi:MAG: type II toxin-antitoxin system VapC family toxin [Propionibacteriaceae bacterium]|jgi:PIN domain nuclease of toxin-antitoxin system|nr:type II toxin-antitoxin system VapC family toxin [Propionibacteriaceae bacterium]
MTLLADTHILIWALNNPARTPLRIKEALADRSRTCLYSPVSLWEISIKYGLGKLDLKGHSPEEFLDELDRSFFECLPLDNHVIATSHELPRLHGDPFDRLLVWQAISSGCTLLSADRAVDQYVPHGLTVIH